MVWIIVLLTYKSHDSINSALVSTGTNTGSTRSGSSKGPSKIAMITFTTDERTYTVQALKNKHDYARKHNYDIHVDFEAPDEQGMMWHKLGMVERLIKDPNNHYDWIWWLDFDILITNYRISLESIITDALANATKPDDIDFILTPDCMELNAGSMLFRAHPRTLDFLSRARAYGKTHSDQSEQDCIRDLIYGNEGDGSKKLDENGKRIQIEKSALFIPQYKINAFPEEIGCYDGTYEGWKDGMFVAHFAGAWAHLKVDDPYGELFRKYGGRVDQAKDL
ncbi:glycosyltransferase family 34 protein [Aulographum hederae CBS 113979]|uniref:Glycosyltransferase family 34 protein n=1 Tax=Aulographum hederae CBS 113979 TaxID=1176131 RepID=A0A6G1GYX4_9PEZI|nr:glycosyltransferase family 34 protein [Aulographum hederae CBS 113979]